MKYKKFMFNQQILSFVAMISLLIGSQLIFAPSSLAVTTVPQVHFFMNGSCPGGGPCGAHYDAESNPSNYAIRAWERCSPSDKILYGGWQSGTENESNTGSCGTFNSFAIQSGFQYDKTHMYQVQCWVSPNPPTGNC